ncbi:MAG: hypothetical protein HY474_01155 [Candidatus Sungbacteria bacterium]|uniref:Uncharacterized protein n=1 Tax=Candidatus Sungiibacteriota bacterium TaxID=2750080 RepID=A0A932YXV2_9BACT|nr:hypothetical protein [Candidatus Sungbacteria bacterium]
MGEKGFGLPPDTLRLVQDRIEGLEGRMLREVNALYQCKHGLLADRCGDCRGMTALGVHADVLTEMLKRRGHLLIELDAEIRGARSMVRHQRPLKTAIGVGIGVSFFLAFAGWKSGKLLLRLINRAAPQES